MNTEVNTQTKQAIILDGKRVANELRTCLKGKVAQLIKETGKKPCLAVCLVGDNPASQVYVRNKEKAANEAGIESISHNLPSNTTQAELTDLIRKLNEDENVHGILVQLPLPKGLDTETLLLQINPVKDVDGLHPFNLGMILAGHPNLIPCTPFGVMRLLKAYNISPAGKKVVVLGRSRLVGKPIAQLLLNADATVTTVHSKTPQAYLEQVVKESDIVVAAIGKANYVKADWLKEDAVIIDVGINRLESGKLVGDVDFEEAVKKAAAITPVPGGIGPLTVAHLLLNTVKAFEIKCFGFSSIEL
ncbi:MAG: bifunctional methylenetetrahydrofolate dehydrogenase/methenyltetrahydrofolate cyclohydrolase FolD [Candidatus Caenarcaniphilales bacterium]|nr:bifunctional methylenetetrahydrofolate dehydrogenase/methenyltetrahydrofolate cyclohydrolase FolD [Candidatus Caenarcaniphilales bacterium]